MIELARAKAPGIKVIVGGYGTALLGEDSPLARELRSLVDEVCAGEGVAWMRSWIERGWGIEDRRPLVQALPDSGYFLFRQRLPLFGQAIFLRSLGCHNRCVFCSTSHQFGGEVLELFGMEELHRSIHRRFERDSRIWNAMVYAEDFLQDREAVLRFADLVSADPLLARRHLSLTVFSSARSVSMYSVEELHRACVGTVFIGVESFCSDILRAEGLAKRGRDDLSGLFGALHAAGIATMGSLILGWDGHDASNIREDMERFVALGPTLYQVVPLHPSPGTPLWRRLKIEGRIGEDLTWDGSGVHAGRFDYAHFSAEEINRLALECYRALARRGGPWPFRQFAVWLEGSLGLAGSPEPFLRTKASQLEAACRLIMPLAFASAALAPSLPFLKRWAALMLGRVLPRRPALFLEGLAAFPLVLILVLVSSALARLAWLLSPSGEQPPFRATRYGGGA
jgi:hypothetical protein